MTPTDQTLLQLNVEAARLMSQCLLYTTARDYLDSPERLQRLFRVPPGRSAMMPPNFLRIDSVGDSLEARSDPALALQTSLAACAGEDSREVVFLVQNDGRKNRIYIGVRHPTGFADSFMGTFQHFFRWVHPGSQLSPIDPRGTAFLAEVSRPLGRMSHGVCLTGIPSAKVSRSASLVSCLDSLLEPIRITP